MRVGSLFSGYDGIGLALESLWPDVHPAWFVEFDAAPSRVLAHHWPDVPNFGDITTLDWDQVEPVDVLTAGYPCQPFSKIGKRKGTADERHLWPHVRDAIRALRPRLAVLENVAGHISMGLDEVLADLAAMGMSARWGVVRAADAGAPHERPRLWITAADSDCVPHRATLGDSVSLAASRGAQLGDRVAGPHAESRPSVDLASTQARTDRYGSFGAAIERWSAVLDRSAPEPLDGLGRLSPAFVEWLMGLPEGHVTDPAIGLTRAQQLKMLGNGVVPQQCALALRMLLGLPAQPAAVDGPMLPTPAVNDMGEGKTPEARGTSGPTP